MNITVKEKKVPNKWKTILHLPLHKKRHALDCANCRDINNSFKCRRKELKRIKEEILKTEIDNSLEES